MTYVTEKGDNSTRGESRIKILSTNVSLLNPVDEPVSIYSYKEIIDPSSNANFNIDKGAYSKTIQHRFLDTPSYVYSFDNSEGFEQNVSEFQPRTYDRSKLDRSRRRLRTNIANENGMRDDFKTRTAATIRADIADEFAKSVTNAENLKQARLSDIIDLAIPKCGYIPASDFLFTFFLGVRQFMCLNQLIVELTQRTFQNDQNCDLDTRSRFLLFLICFWMDTMPYDFRDPLLMKLAKELFISCIKSNTAACIDVRYAMGKLLRELKKLEIFENYLERQNRLNTLTLDLEIYEICPDPEVLAKQLFIIEVEHLKHIGPEEYVQYLKLTPHYSKDASKSQNCSKALTMNNVMCKHTFNIEMYVRWVNRLSYYIATEIVKQLRRRKRSYAIQYFIDVAEHCLKMNNFNSTMAIISGLDSNSIKRLSRTWEKVEKNYIIRFHYFESLLSVSNNFATYRTALADAAKKYTPSFYIPFFCVSLKDVHYVNEAMPDFVGDGLVNVSKLYKISEFVYKLNELRNSIYVPFDRREDLVEILTTSPVFDSATAMAASFQCEKE